MDSEDQPKAAVSVRGMRPEHAERVAQLHVDGIPTGLLAELGAPFLARLYQALADSEESFVIVAVDEQERVAGFISGVTSVRAMYRTVLRRNAIQFGMTLIRYAFSARMIRRIINTLRYPAKVEGQYPSAELLSIVVSPEARGTGAASALLGALLAEFRVRNVNEIKVMVRADFDRANAFYRKHGFQAAGQISSHGHPSNIYTLETAQA